MKNNKRVRIGFIAVLCVALTACVTEEVVSTKDFPGGENERRQRIDSLQQVKTVESPKQQLFTQPDTTKYKTVKRNG